MRSFTTEESVITLYFSAYRITSEGVAGLLKHKCRSSFAPVDILEKLVDLKAEGGLWDQVHSYWNFYEVGRYIAGKIPDTNEFEKLTYFGDEEEVIVTTESQGLRDEGLPSGTEGFSLKEEDRALDNRIFFSGCKKESILNSVRSEGINKGIMNHITLAYYCRGDNRHQWWQDLHVAFVNDIFGTGIGPLL